MSASQGESGAAMGSQESPSGSKGLTALYIGLVILIGAGLGVLIFKQTSKPLPALFEVPAFSLTDQSGDSFGRDQMMGELWVADFVFTRCGGICPMLTSRMKKLTDEVEKDETLAGRVRFLSISVDPAYDTPERLKAYGEKYGADFSRWSFLTGPPEDVRTLVTEGFHIAMGHAPLFKGEGPASGVDIGHGEHFVLVDTRGQIRGFYDQEPLTQQKLRRELRQLAREEPK